MTPGLIHSYSGGDFIFCKRPCICASQLGKHAGGLQFLSELVSLPLYICNPYYYPYIQIIQIHIIQMCWIFFSGATFLLWELIVCHSPSVITIRALRPARSRCCGLCCHQVETSMNSKDLTSKSGGCWCINASGVALRLPGWTTHSRAWLIAKLAPPKYYAGDCAIGQPVSSHASVLWDKGAPLILAEVFESAG